MNKKQFENYVKNLTKEIMVESTNQEKKKLINLLIKMGNNPEKAKKMVDQNYDYICRVYPSSTSAKKKAEIITSISLGPYK